MTQREAIEIFDAVVAHHLAPESLTGAAAEGNIAATRAFLEAGANIEEKSVGFSSPLQAAVNMGRAETVELLLTKGASVEKKPEALYSPLSAAVTWGHTTLFRRLIALVHDTSGERAALVTLASYGQLPELRLLLEKGAMPDGRYAIAAAAKNGHYEIVKYLVDAGVAWKEFGALRIPEGARDAGFTELFKYLSGQPYDEAAAIAAGHAAHEKRMTGLSAQMAAVAEKRKPADPEERDRLLTAARTAVAAGALKAILDQPVINADKVGKVTPLIAAALVGDSELVESLVAAGANPAPKLKGGLLAKTLARGPSRPAIVTFLEAAAKRPASKKKPKT